MNLKVTPPSSLRGVIDLPASKSYSIRAFIIAACGGRSRVIGASDCDDAQVARGVAQALGARVVQQGREHKIVVGAIHESPFGARIPTSNLTVNVRESGTSLRFVLPLLPFHAASARVQGQGTLVGRPNKHLCAALRAIGLDIKGVGPGESVPVDYKGGAFPGGKIRVDGSVSSQFISALLIACPRAVKDSRLVVTGPAMVSREYITMTLQVLARAGIKVKEHSAREFRIPGGQTFKGLGAFHVPSDWGLAAFLMAAGALVPSNLTLNGYFDDHLVQADGAILLFFRRMGVRFTRSARSLRVRGPFALKGGTFSLRDCPDLVPIMAVTAMFAKGVTRLKHIGHARVKESDRISDLRQELLKVGADIEETADELVIRPRASYKSGVVLDPHHDHRLAMAFAVLGLRMGVTVKDMECTAKSYPSFVRDLKKIM